MRECEFAERDQPRIGRVSLAGRYRPYALIETPTPSLCGYRKHSRRTCDLPYANIIDLPRSLLLAVLSRTAVCTRSRKTAVCVGPKGTCSFSVARGFRISILDVVVTLQSGAGIFSTRNYLSYHYLYIQNNVERRRNSRLRKIKEKL